MKKITPHDSALFVILLLVTALISVQLSADEPQSVLSEENLLRITKADLVTGKLQTEEAPQVPLPDRRRGENHYQIRFDKVFDMPLWGVYIPKRQWHLTLFINDEMVGKFDDKDISLHNWLTPAHSLFPQTLLKEHDNILEIRLQGPGPSTWLSEVYIGEAGIIKDMYSWRYFTQITSQLFIAILILGFSVLSLVIWLKDKNQDAHFWFSVTTFFWALHTGVKLVPVPYYLDHLIWQIVMNSALLWFVYAGFLFLWKLARNKTPGAPQFLLLITMLMQAALLWFLIAQPQHYLFFGKTIFMPYVLLLGLFTTILAVRNLVQSGQLVMLSTGTALVTAAGAHDVMIIRGVIDGDYVLQYSAPVLLSLFMFELVNQFIQSIKEKRAIYQSFNVTPEIITNSEIDWQTVKEAERASARTEERDRIRKELHDGVSGTLSAVIASLNKAPDGKSRLLLPLQQCVAELRTIIDATSFEDDNLVNLLAAFRQFLQPQIELVGIKFHWQVLALNEEITLPPGQAIELFRMLQEMCSNSFKHAGARNLTISAASHLDDKGKYQVLIKVKDDGVWKSDATRRGAGLNNISQRAQQIGAAITRDAEMGTCWEIRLSLGRGYDSLPH